MSTVDDGTIEVRDGLTGVLLTTITPDFTKTCRKLMAAKKRAAAEHESFWEAALDHVTDACATAELLADLRANDRLDDLAGWLMIFGNKEGFYLFRETLMMSGTFDGVPAEDVEKIIFEAWIESDHYESPDDWRDLLRHVRKLQGDDSDDSDDSEGDEPPRDPASVDWRELLRQVRELEGDDGDDDDDDDDEPPRDPAKIGAVPEASHLATDQMNASRLAAHFGGKELVSSSKSFYVWQGTHWERDPSDATRYGAQLSAIVREEAKGWRETFESMAALNPDGKKLEATVRRDMSRLEDNLRATSEGLAMVNALYKAEALEKWQKSCEMRTNITNALALLRDLLTVDSESFDRNPALLNCQNGTIDLRTGRIKKHDPSDSITRCAPVSYVPTAQAPRFKKFLAEILDPERSKLLQRWFGYCMTGDVREQKMLVHIGEGSNGKSTLLELIEEVTGEYSHTAPRGLLTGSNGDERHPTEIAALFGRRLVTAAESEDNATLRESFVKQATGGDRLSGRYMHKDFFSFRPTHKLQLLTNFKPTIRGADYGIWRRLLLLQYEIKFGTAEDVAAGRAMQLRDPTLKDALLAEREGIFAWLVQGAIEWYRDGLQPPSSVLEASEAYRQEQDRVGQFVHECCALEPDTWSPFSGAFIGIYPAYGSWCRESGYQALGLKRFVDELARIVPKFRKAERKLNIDGIRKTVNGAFGVMVNTAGASDSAADGCLV